MKYQISNAPAFLYDTGISFHERGKLLSNGVELFDYYKCDCITDEQKQTVLNWCKDTQFKFASPKYAPEIRKVLICFPKVGFYRNQNKERHKP